MDLRGQVKSLQATVDSTGEWEDLDQILDGIEDLLARNERLEFELKVKSEFLSSRQCPDHSGKWQRGDCLQCRIEQLEAAQNNPPNT